MGSLFRSEEMCLAQFYFQSEAAFSCVSELGELGMVQFRDLNAGVNAFQRKFVNEVRRCDEMERKLRFLEKELKRDNILIDDDGENPSAPLPKEMNDLEARFEKLESDIKEVNANEDTLKKNFQELTELKHILRKAQYFFDEAITHHEQQEGAGPSSNTDEASQSLLYQDFNQQDHRLRLGFVAGVIPMEKLGPFERVLWRACRGNVFLRYEEIETPFKDWKTDEEVHKCVFIIFFQGDQLKSRVRSICEGFHANLYPCPDSAQERREVAIGVMTRLEDLQAVLTQTSEHRRTLLSQVAMNIRVWFIKIRKIKAIYATLNMFNVNTTDKCLIAEGWCPLMDLDQIRGALRHGTSISGSTVPSILQQMKTTRTPPTYNRNNAFTGGFQGIIDAFGICTYLEVNPAPFTIVTFPFLFGVMFGDLGHGLIMFLFALYLVLNERRFSLIKTDNDIWLMTFGGRYLILLMGAFSIYTGFLYNECFSRSINLFGSAWNVSEQGISHHDLEHHHEFTLDPMKAGVCRGRDADPTKSYSIVDGTNVSTLVTNNAIPYLYGFDPIWLTAENKITFSNSYKMKSAVLLGMAQMYFGLALSYVNLKYFKKKLEFYCEWIPQMIFISCMIGYLCICILVKWATVRDPHRAPSLLIGLIDMFMFKGPNELEVQLLYPGQGAIQKILVLLAFIAVPWMLIAKPYVLYQRHKKPVSAADTRYSEIQVNVDDDEDHSIIHHDQLATTNDMMSDDDDDVGHSHGDHGEEFDFTEIMIHQSIHTIEFCLNCISHTASYLRLWALSLAHSELSEVLWGMVMHVGLSTKGTTGAVMTFLIFWMFSSLTVGILLMMEGLSAFLHALRLHWVEFQSKFFAGEGFAFEPLTFTHIVEGKADD